ncbi:RagB/SusD family nutrient uptake outer membrane protein [Niabella insulamsoli]|uniref:RagB/SusD family nutrient uptake outer membrane protein n=1 Tax=Niabella insulamsoli TaxID=3144874 RepID=UPI0031FDA3E8
MKIFTNITRYVSICFLFCAGVTLLGCQKQLRQGPINATYSGYFWTSQTSVEQAALAMYGQLRSNLREASGNGVDMNPPCHFVWGDLVSSNFRYAGGGTFLQYGLSATPTVSAKPWNFSYVPYWTNLSNWSRFYQLIAQCNLVIENVSQMPLSLFASAEVRNSYIAEALFMRAYTYFYVTRIWGDPVYVSKTYNDVDYGSIPPVPRSPEKQVLDSCLKDLSNAANFLSYTAGDPQKSIRANKGSVEALKAHIFAWKHEYDSAHFYCDKVINNAGYELEPIGSYKNIWNGQVSKENIFELPMKFENADPNFNSQNSWAEAQFNGFGVFLKGVVVDNRRTSCWIAPLGGIVVATNGGFGLFGDSTSQDKRYRSILFYQNAGGGDPAGYMLLKYTNFFYQNSDTKTRPYLNNNLVLLRLADIILLNAESLTAMGRLNEAKQMLKLTEDRAGINSYESVSNQYDLMDEVVMERGREFIGEGSWFYDLIRTNQTQGWLEYVGYPAERVTPQNKGYYWPIDMAALFPYNNLLVQNPWWANNGGR